MFVAKPPICYLLLNISDNDSGIEDFKVFMHSGFFEFFPFESDFLFCFILFVTCLGSKSMNIFTHIFF